MSAFDLKLMLHFAAFSLSTHRVFFDNSDGIFLNYTWNEEKLKQSVVNAAERRNDVFVGVDVFGRNCFGGGGWNTKEVMT